MAGKPEEAASAYLLSYEASRDPYQLLLAAESYERAGRKLEARLSVERYLLEAGEAEKQKSRHERALEMRARLAQTGPGSGREAARRSPGQRPAADSRSVPPAASRSHAPRPAERSPAPTGRGLEEAKEYQAKAMAELGAGRVEAAIEHYKQAYRVYPDPRILRQLGQIYEKSGRLGEAVRAYEQYLGRLDQMASPPKLSGPEVREVVLAAIGRLREELGKEDPGEVPALRARLREMSRRRGAPN